MTVLLIVSLEVFFPDLHSLQIQIVDSEVIRSEMETHMLIFLYPSPEAKWVQVFFMSELMSSFCFSTVVTFLFRRI